jgi:hypothetical protein
MQNRVFKGRRHLSGMHELMEKRKEEKKLMEELVKKHPHLASQRNAAMSEGPMLIDETKGIEERARQQYEKSVKIELAEIKRLRKLLAKYKRRKGKIVKRIEKKEDKD